MKLQNNLKHLNIVDKLVKAKENNGYSYTMPLLKQSVIRLFPAYKDDSKLEVTLQAILACK